MAKRPPRTTRRATLADLCDLITDGKHGDCTPDESSGYYFLSCKDVRDGKLTYDGARQIAAADFVETHRRTRLEPGDILITNSGTIGRMAIAPDVALTRRTTFQKSVAIVKADVKKVDRKWLYYYLLAEMPRLSGVAGGTAQKNLLLRDMRSFEVELPDRNAQLRTASTLSAYDDLIENNTRRIAILEEMARRIYEEWFVRFRFPGHEGVRMVESELGLVPEGWSFRRLDDLVDDVREGVNPDAVATDTPYVGLEHIPRRSLALAEWGQAADVASTKLRFREGDILFGKIRPYFHKVAVAPVAGVASSDAIVIRAKRAHDFGLALAVVSSDAFVAHATQTSNGTKMPRANWGVLRQYPVPTPPRALQAQFEQFMSSVATAVANHVLRNRNLRTTRDLLLPKLISGELDVTAVPEPDAETA